MVDYQKLYLEKCRESREQSSRIQQLESSRQRIYERTLLNVRNLQEQLNSVHDEARQRNDKIQSFLASFLPQFQRASSNNNSSDDRLVTDHVRSTRLQQQQDTTSWKPLRGETLCDGDRKHDSAYGTSVCSSPPPSTIPSPVSSPETTPVPMPKVEYQWSETNLGSSSYHFLTRSNPYCGKVDELKLCLKFDVNSKELPTKIQLEMTDPKTGRVVFKKRQNIYYVKLQERVSVLEARQNYNLEIKSINGQDECVDNITIYSKDIVKDSLTVGKSSKCKELNLETAIEDFLEDTHYLESDQIPPSAHDRLLTRAESTTDSSDHSLHRATKTSCVVLTRTPPATPANIPKHESPARRKSSPLLSDSTSFRLRSPSPHSTIASPSSGLVLSKPLSVPSVKYRWQRGFRKAHNGRYVKVPILRLAFRFEDHRHQLLPTWLDLRLNGDNPESNTEKRCNLSGREGMCELQLDDGHGHEITVEGGGGASISSNTGGGGGGDNPEIQSLDHLMPDFTLKVDCVGPTNFNQWQKTPTSIKEEKEEGGGARG